MLSAMRPGDPVTIVRRGAPRLITRIVEVDDASVTVQGGHRYGRRDGRRLDREGLAAEDSLRPTTEEDRDYLLLVAFSREVGAATYRHLDHAQLRLLARLAEEFQGVLRTVKSG